MARVVIVTLYNPGAMGARYVAAALRATGHEVWLLHFKELRSTAVPNHDIERHKALESDHLLYVKFQHPGETLYVPYPTPITETERDLFVAEIDRIKPDLLAFSLFTVTAGVARELTDRLRACLPDLPVLWGGLHAVLDPEGCLESADIACAGEGEDAMPELMDRWGEYRRLGALDIPGLWFRKGDEIVRNPKRELIEDLDRLAFPAYGEQELLIEDDEVGDKLSRNGPYLNAHMLVFTSRGCPYHCSYCVHSILNKDKAHARFRRRSVENALAECEALLGKHDLRHFVFHDEILLTQRPWVLEFARQFKARFASRGCTFTGYVHPLATDAEMIDAMCEAGMTRTGMGIQTGSRRVAKEVFHRPFDPDKTIEMSRLLAERPFEIVQYDLLVNNPFETEPERRETFEFLMELSPPFQVETFGLVVYPDSTLAQMTPVETPDPDQILYYNMLYFLTGVSEISREALRQIADNPRYRAHPRELEALAIGVYGMFLENWRLRWEADWRDRASSQTTPGASARRRLRAILEALVP